MIWWQQIFKYRCFEEHGLGCLWVFIWVFYDQKERRTSNGFFKRKICAAHKGHTPEQGNRWNMIKSQYDMLTIRYADKGHKGHTPLRNCQTPEKSRGCKTMLATFVYLAVVLGNSTVIWGWQCHRPFFVSLISKLCHLMLLKPLEPILVQHDFHRFFVIPPTLWGILKKPLSFSSNLPTPTHATQDIVSPCGEIRQVWGSLDACGWEPVVFHDEMWIVFMFTFWREDNGF